MRNTEDDPQEDAGWPGPAEGASLFRQALPSSLPEGVGTSKEGKSDTPSNAFLAQVRARGLPEPVSEHRFAHPRRWRFDFCYPDRKLAVEIEGGTWTRGRHSRPVGYRNDCVKYAEAVLAGWRVLRFTSDMVQDGSGLELLARALEKETAGLQKGFR